jgi:hypothetical protein
MQVVLVLQVKATMVEMVDPMLVLHKTAAAAVAVRVLLERLLLALMVLMVVLVQHLL